MSEEKEDIGILKSDIETYRHVKAVRENLNIFIKELIDRAQHHDDSKFESPEREIFGANYTKLGQTVYGTPEYENLLKEVKPALDNHYAKNRHHTEHWDNGVNGMSLLDLVEMLADWMAAIKRNKNGNIHQSLERNAAKYNFSPQLKEIFKNTIREYCD